MKTLLFIFIIGCALFLTGFYLFKKGCMTAMGMLLLFSFPASFDGVGRSPQQVFRAQDF